MDDERRAWLHRTARKCGYRIRRGYARELRKNQTHAERALWEALRAYKTGGAGWRRQHIVDRFIVDFVHLGSKLAVEVDGGYHQLDKQQQLDKERDEALNSLGWTVIRVTNKEVLSDAHSFSLKLSVLAEDLVLRATVPPAAVLPVGESVGPAGRTVAVNDLPNTPFES